MSRGLCYGNGYFITVRARYGKAEDLIRLRYLAAPAATLTITKTCSTYVRARFICVEFMYCQRCAVPGKPHTRPGTAQPLDRLGDWKPRFSGVGSSPIRYYQYIVTLMILQYFLWLHSVENTPQVA